MNRETVMVRIPPTPEHLALLRTAVAGFAARDHFTLDQVDDLRLAVEEGAVQLLKHVTGEGLTLTVSRTEPGIEVRLSADVAGDDPVIDEESFSWVILRALADDVAIEMQQGHAAIVLAKHRLATAPQLDQDDQDDA
ncbi:MAG TPA: ATP-binding protein [Egibacteraceae bacterium]|nr:ATP-binding protein [Egibacteraceae bacterium]